MTRALRALPFVVLAILFGAIAVQLWPAWIPLLATLPADSADPRGLGYTVGVILAVSIPGVLAGLSVRAALRALRH